MSRAGLGALVAANLLVALQAVWHEWGYYETMLVYWIEVAILGVYNVARLVVVGVFGAAPLGAWVEQYVDWGGPLNRLIFTVIGIVFFVVKFGGFALAIGLFVVLLPALLTPDGDSSGGETIFRALAGAGPGLLLAAAALAVSHGISFARNFLAGREFDRLTIVELVFWPYLRMSLVAVILLLGVAIARLVPGAGGQTAFVVIMVLLKLGADAASHTLEHRGLGDRDGSRARLRSAR